MRGPGQLGVIPQYRNSVSDLLSAANGHGGHGYGGYCPEGVPVEIALLSIMAAFGVSFGILYRTFTLETGGRRKRSSYENDSLPNPMAQAAADIFWLGKTITFIVYYKYASCD